jgi:hypothetical protein
VVGLVDRVEVTATVSHHTLQIAALANTSPDEVQGRSELSDQPLAILETHGIDETRHEHKGAWRIRHTWARQGYSEGRDPHLGLSAQVAHEEEGGGKNQ